MPAVTVNNPNFPGERTLTYDLYSDAALDNLGRMWEEGSGDAETRRCILSTGWLSRADLDALPADKPAKIMFHRNVGGHWVGVGVTVGPQPNRDVTIAFSDSNDSKAVEIPAQYKDLVDKIAQPFVDKFGVAKVTKKTYEHTWDQGSEGTEGRAPDSCGAYTIANVSRFLDGKGDEENPGGVKLRREQCTLMTNSAAISGVSFSNTIMDAAKSFDTSNPGKRFDPKAPPNNAALTAAIRAERGLVSDASELTNDNSAGTLNGYLDKIRVPRLKQTLFELKKKISEPDFKRFVEGGCKVLPGTTVGADLMQKAQDDSAGAFAFLCDQMIKTNFSNITPQFVAAKEAAEVAEAAQAAATPPTEGPGVEFPEIAVEVWASSSSEDTCVFKTMHAHAKAYLEQNRLPATPEAIKQHLASDFFRNDATSEDVNKAVQKSISEAIKAKRLKSPDKTETIQTANGPGVKYLFEPIPGGAEVEQFPTSPGSDKFIFRPNDKFNGPIRVQRKGADGKPEPGQMDIIEYKNGEPIATSPATKGTSMLANNMKLNAVRAASKLQATKVEESVPGQQKPADTPKAPSSTPRGLGLG